MHCRNTAAGTAAATAVLLLLLLLQEVHGCAQVGSCCVMLLHLEESTTPVTQCHCVARVNCYFN